MTILVTGATGTVGRQLCAQLAAAGHPVRGLTRHPEKADLPAGVEVVGGDLTSLQGLSAALTGVSAVHLIAFGGDDYALLPNGPELVALARAAGVRRVTVLMNGDDSGSVGQAVQDSDLGWVFLAPVEFMSNALAWAESIHSEGVVREPFAAARSAMVHEADIAAVAAHALTEEGHAGATYTITGPQALTVPEKVQVLSEAVGTQVTFEELTEEQARARWAEVGFGPEEIEFFVWASNGPEIGATPTATVSEVTGLPGRTFAEWAAENAAAFRG